MLPRRGCQQPKRNPEPKKKHGVFVQDPKATTESEEKPQLGFPPFRMRRHNRRARIQNTGSNAFIEKKLSNVSRSEQEHAKCSEELAYFPPPSSRASHAPEILGRGR